MFKINFINKSYKDKLRATYTLLMFVVLFLLSILLYFQMNSKVKPIIHDIGEPVVVSKAHYLGELFNDQSKVLEILSDTEAFKNGKMSVIKQELDNQIHKNGDLMLSIKYKSITGEEYSNNHRNIKTPDGYEKELLAANSSTLKSQATFNENLGEYIIFTGAKVIDDNGNVKGVLTSSICVKEVTTSLNKIKKESSSEIWIFDSLGNVIVSTNKEKASMFDIESFKKNVQTGQPGEIKTINSKDSSNNLAYCQIPNTQNLYLATRIEHVDFKNAMKSLLFIILFGAIVFCCFIFVAAHKMTNFITNPLTRMVEIIENSEGINFIEIPNDLKASKDEIGILANTIDKMAKNIRNNMQKLNGEIKERKKAEKHLLVLNDELECRVQERTEALTKVTNNLAISEDRFRIAM